MALVPISTPPPVEPQRVPTREEESYQLLLDGRRPTSKPKRTPQDVWEIAREMTENGGLLDLTEEVASVHAINQQVRKLLDEKEVKPMRAVEALARNVDRLVRAKHTHINIQKKRGDALSAEEFQAFLDEIFAVLNRHIRDPIKLRAIGADLKGPLARLRARRNS